MQKTLAVMAIAALAGAATGQIAQWDLQGAPGNQAFTVGSATANVTALNLTRGAGLTASAAANSISSAGWTQEATDYFAFGFTVDSGFSVNLASLFIGTRSSNTAPATLRLAYSVDNYASTLFTFDQTPGANFVNSQINLSSLTGLTGTVEFRIYQVGTAAAAGGASASTGTVRLTGFFQNGVFDRNLQFTGTVIPTPGAVALAGIAGLVGLRRRR